MEKLISGKKKGHVKEKASITEGGVKTVKPTHLAFSNGAEIFPRSY